MHGKCRIGSLEGDPRLFIEAMDAIEEAEPRRVNRAAVQRGLKALGVDVHVTIVQDHYNRDCACART